MNWFKDKSLKEKIVTSSIIDLCPKKKIVKLAYMTKGHETGFNDTMDKDCKEYTFTLSPLLYIISLRVLQILHNVPTQCLF